MGVLTMQIQADRFQFRSHHASQLQFKPTSTRIIKYLALTFWLFRSERLRFIPSILAPRAFTGSLDADMYFDNITAIPMFQLMRSIVLNRAHICCNS